MIGNNEACKSRKFVIRPDGDRSHYFAEILHLVEEFSAGIVNGFPPHGVLVVSAVGGRFDGTRFALVSHHEHETIASQFRRRPLAWANVFVLTGPDGTDEQKMALIGDAFVEYVTG